MAPPPLLHVLLPLLLVSVFFAASTVVPDCTPYRCGDGGNITYPFWHVDGVKSSKSYCGYMFMGLTCKDGSLTLPIDFINYKVKNVNTSNRMFLLIDADVEDTKCPWDRKNLTLEVGFTRLFHYAPSASNLTFLFNCTRHLPSMPPIVCCNRQCFNRSYRCLNRSYLCLTPLLFLQEQEQEEERSHQGGGGGVEARTRKLVLL